MSTIDEGIAILTGVPAGKLSKKGVYPEGTINRMVVDRLTDPQREGPRGVQKEQGRRRGKDASRVAEAE